MKIKTMSEPTEPISVKNIAERRSSIEIISRDSEPIGEGVFGKVYRVQARIGNRVCHFVMKEFLDNVFGTKKENAKNAFENYRQARKAGLKVFPTYRITETGDKILMTLGTDADWVCLGSLISISKSHEYRQSAERIDNFQNLIDKVFEQAITAAKLQILLPGDSYFFFLDIQTKTQADFVIGDLDRVLGKPIVNAQRHNISVALAILRDFFKIILKPNAKNPHEVNQYINAVDITYYRIMAEAGFNNA